MKVISKKISIFGNVYFFYYWIFKCTLFLVSRRARPCFFLFSLSPPALSQSPHYPLHHIFECRVTSFIFIQILVAATLKHTATVVCLPNVGLRGRTLIFESVFFAVVVDFFFLLNLYTIHAYCLTRAKYEWQ